MRLIHHGHCQASICTAARQQAATQLGLQQVPATAPAILARPSWVSRMFAAGMLVKAGPCEAAEARLGKHAPDLMSRCSTELCEAASSENAWRASSCSSSRQMLTWCRYAKPSATSRATVWPLCAYASLEGCSQHRNVLMQAASSAPVVPAQRLLLGWVCQSVPQIASHQLLQLAE